MINLEIEEKKVNVELCCYVWIFVNESDPLLEVLKSGPTIGGVIVDKVLFSHIVFNWWRCIIKDIFIGSCAILNVGFKNVVGEILIAKIIFKGNDRFKKVYNPDSLVSISCKKLNILRCTQIHCCDVCCSIFLWKALILC